MLGDKIKNLRKRNGLTQQQLADTLEISRSAVGMVEKNLQGIGTEALTKLSEFFNVSYDFLLNDSEIDTCSICRFEYCPLEKEDYEHHKIRHNNFLNFPERDLFLTYSNREIIKRKSQEILQDNSSIISEKVNAAVNLYKSWYARSIEDSNFNINHPLFNEYIAMMLNRKDSKKYLSEPVYNLLIQKYGLKEGIPDGESYSPLKIINHENTKEEISLLENFNKLNSLGKKEARKRISELAEITKYIENTYDETSSSKNNIIKFNVAEEQSEYTLAAHDDDLDSKTAKRNLNKAKEIFKQMDNE
ncbi:helix-turn-helix transcriptional regulator [Clostridium sp. ZS1]|uniref:helix-turn-helix domain-containing protein n=1 Tax=Clostridium sp. ZS1 TaxID=2949989 RepID=UPI00207A83FA|nr:helix-turn-helix transcriptional regulator [Clostridium sp. ZS1]